MAQDQTFSVRVSPDLKEKVQEMIEASGLASTKEWFEKLLLVYEMETLKQGAPGYERELNELSIHTNRIEEMVANIIRRSIFEQGKLKEDQEKVLLEKEEEIQAAKSGLSECKAQLEGLQELLQNAVNEKTAAEKLVKQYEETNERNKELIGEYKEKINDLNARLVDSEAVMKEYLELKEEIHTQKDLLKDRGLQVKDLTQTIDRLKESHEKDIEMLKNQHKIELERTIEKKDREREKDIFELQTKWQAKVEELTVAGSEKIQALYEELNGLRKQMDDMRTRYERQIEKLKGQQ
ncbi:hypothetical protein JK635_07480 [Neobacillus sp. YIM B02564]|uniref:Uncharacterized protein n=1 Tax=Neobacillus paridis TaxID=2803862 RepID=A0ABS1TQ79_9BACI|nr:hypothetical protein [Neobacillus paridis]MBL4952050.1 hypothetical protein [Neobacillus paridis]